MSKFSWALDTFDRTTREAWRKNYLHTSYPPTLDKAIKAKRNLRLLKFGAVGLSVVTVFTLWAVLPPEVSFGLFVAFCILSGIFAVCWSIGIGIPMFVRWVRKQKNIVDEADRIGVIDE